MRGSPRPVVDPVVRCAPVAILRLVTLLAGVAAAPACIDSVPFDPSGDEVTLSGGWKLSVNGGAPVDANATLCAQSDFATIQLVLIDWATEQRWEGEKLRFACGPGAFDTRPVPVLENGNFHAQWVAYDVRGTTRQVLPRSVLDVEQAQHGVVETGIFDVFDPSGSDVSLEGTWRVVDGSGDEVVPDMSACGEAAIDRVRLEIFSEEEPERLFVPEGLTFPCAQGSFATTGPVLARGRYAARWAALSRTGVVLTRSSSFTLDATASDHVVVEAGVLRTRRTSGKIVVEPEWEKEEGSYEGCGGADVEMMSWAFRGPDGCVDCPAEPRPCGSKLRFEDVPFDLYTLTVSGSGPNGSWAGECTLRHGATRTLRTRCRADRVE